MSSLDLVGKLNVNNRVCLQSSGTHFTVEPDENVLDAALRQNVVLAYGCRNGSCGTCKAQVVDGKYTCTEHDSEALTIAESEARFTLLCRTYAKSDLVIAAREIKGASDFPLRRLPARVDVMEPLNHDVVRLILKLPNGQRLQYVAGQYIDVLLRDGKKRSFSIANAPTEFGDTIELHIRHQPGGAFSEQVIGQLRVKSILRIEGPFGQFFWRGDSNRIPVLVAGGTGFAPIKALIEDRFAHQEKTPLQMYWGIRSSQDLYLETLLQAWQTSHSNFTFIPVQSKPNTSPAWTGRTGWVHETVFADWPDCTELDIYSCGPPLMIRALRDGALARGLPADRFFCDPFEPARD